MENQPLDPRKTPWSRGDIVMGSENKAGIVSSCSPQFIEIRWGPSGPKERFTIAEADRIIRIAHAASPSPHGGKSNLDVLNDLEALDNVGKALDYRIRSFKSEKEKEQADRLARRVFSGERCNWDKKNETELYLLLVKPNEVGAFFKLRERIHRIFCKRHE